MPSSTADRLREAICSAHTAAEMDAAGAELYAAGTRGAITAAEYSDLKALGGRCRAALREAPDYDFEERAGILEFEAGYPRAEAERRAREMTTPKA
jgi:hypothetical protein